MEAETRFLLSCRPAGCPPRSHTSQSAFSRNISAGYSSLHKTASINKGMEKSKNEVIPLTEVLTKSMCQPREVLVDIFQEYPEDTEHAYIPSCVVLNRCGGCCNDEAMECVPTETHNVTLQVMRYRPMKIQHIIDLSFTEHQKCVCRVKPDVQVKKE
ncbi:vascular endothelial growth factor A-A-like isoform X3 [Mastacembelus armatus]|uniref:vascular endothelial growth factor A-A-like isoform X1 n=1 Tax=Mastacembelus armatus TaxID=205130 RepID=UPI000E466116|nr:vascular endothelial growth factor A-A-like isoform X1 [Mastacembelus armatus]XP_026149173.1 vascular endothelial growth factor A-A-like isoform X2 [Mastacembelus armatus]XP_026149174.1 vascular endothelial growth factor A-A-like isoform X3 [Mastacembelus armatus]XP_026149175.1 vascular endothelial growth factor A-A-like isoform X3 [Mastacembelus armatus]